MLVPTAEPNDILNNSIKYENENINLEHLEHLDQESCEVVIAVRETNTILNDTEEIESKTDEDVNESDENVIGPWLPKLMTKAEVDTFFKEMMAEFKSHS